MARKKRDIDTIEYGHTQRGFGIVRFTDQNFVECSLQKSSGEMEECVWFGCDKIGLKEAIPGKGWVDIELEGEREGDNPLGINHISNSRMHLTQSNVELILPHLQHFVETGELPETITFSDRGRNKCSLRKSSVATEDRIWLGSDDVDLQKFIPYKGWESVPLKENQSANTHMHLNQAQVETLLPYLHHFVETGELA